MKLLIMFVYKIHVFVIRHGICFPNISQFLKLYCQKVYGSVATYEISQ